MHKIQVFQIYKKKMSTLQDDTQSTPDHEKDTENNVDSQQTQIAETALKYPARIVKDDDSCHEWSQYLADIDKTRIQSDDTTSSLSSFPNEPENFYFSHPFLLNSSDILKMNIELTQLKQHVRELNEHLHQTLVLFNSQSKSRNHVFLWTLTLLLLALYALFFY